MTLEFALEREDYLNLYISQVKKGKVIYVLAIIIGTISLILGMLDFIESNDFGEMLPLVPSGIFLLSYAFFLKTWLLKRHYGKYIDENLTSSLGKTTSLTIGEGEYIHSVSSLGEGKIKLEVLKEIIEYSNYIFLKIETGAFFILPKEKINDFELNAFIDKIKEKVDIPHSIDLKRTLSY